MSWNKSPTEAIPEINLQHAGLVVRLGNDVFNAIVFASPVREGTYRANHNASEGAPDNKFDKSKKFVSISPFENPIPFSNLFITTGAPYAEPLEHGHSQQASSVYKKTYNSFRSKV